MRRLESGRIRRHYSSAAEWLRELSTFKATVFCLLVPLLSVGVVLSEPSVSGASPVLSISISGDHFVNQNGLTVRLSGVNVPSSEYACEQGWGYGGLEGSSPAQDAETAATIAAWDADAVRVPLNEDCWLGLNGQPSFGSQSGYQQSIEDWVNALNADGIYVILDLHWSAPGTTVADGQRPMPDNHSAAFWTSVATTFKSNSAVVFDIFNEPYSPAADGFTNWPVSWSCWLNGGCTVPDSADGQTPNPSQTYTAVGMQTLVNAIRTTGSSQPIMVGGLSYANDLSGWLANEPTDPDGQLAASFHNYDGESCDSLSCWNSIVAPVAAEVPVVTGEFDQGYDCLNGPPNDGFDNAYMNWADQNGVSYLAWGWWELNPGSPTPGCSTYSDDGNSTYALIDGSGNALAPDGTALQTHLAALSGSIPAPGLIGISPTSGPEAGGTAVVITGTNFTGASNVSFGSTSAATFTVNSATEITATSPVGTGTIDVTVTTSAGVTDTSAADQFTYMGSSCDPPSFTSAGSATAAAGVPFTFTVTTCSTSTPVIKASHLPAGLRLVSNDNGTATISGTPAAHDSGAYGGERHGYGQGPAGCHSELRHHRGQRPGLQVQASVHRPRRGLLHLPDHHPIRLPDTHDHHDVDPSHRDNPHRQCQRHCHTGGHARSERRWRLPDHDYRYQRDRGSGQPVLCTDRRPVAGDRPHRHRHDHQGGGHDAPSDHGYGVPGP